MENNKRTYKEAVDIMVNWWIDKSFHTALNQNNGDDSEHGGTSFLLMNLVSMKAKERTSDAKVEAFKKKLTEILLSKEGQKRHANQLDVDYHPNRNLSEACSHAGIDEYCLPCKTFTFIDENNKVKGRYQYGGEWFEL